MHQNKTRANYNFHQREKERGREGERFAPEISAATTVPVGHARLSCPRAAALAGGGVVVRDARHKKKREAATVIGNRGFGRSGGKRLLDRKGLSSTMKDFEKL